MSLHSSSQHHPVHMPMRSAPAANRIHHAGSNICARYRKAGSVDNHVANGRIGKTTRLMPEKGWIPNLTLVILKTNRCFPLEH